MRINNLIILASLVLTLFGTAQVDAQVPCNGTVQVRAVLNHIVIRGDGQDNCIDVDTVANQLTVVGMNGTVVNGSPVNTAGTKLVLIGLFAGNDQIRFLNINSPDISWIVQTHRGRDFVGMGAVGLKARKLIVYMGAGEDQVDLEQSLEVTLPSRISGGLNDDSLELGVVNALNVSGRVDFVQFESLVTGGN